MSDALLVIHLMQQSLYDLLSDDQGVVDSKRSRGTSKSAQMSKFVGLLANLAQQRSSDVFTYSELFQFAQQLELKQIDRFDLFVDQLNQTGHLIKRGGNVYKLCSA